MGEIKEYTFVYSESHKLIYILKLSGKILKVVVVAVNLQSLKQDAHHPVDKAIEVFFLRISLV